MSGVRTRPFEPGETWSVTNRMESAVALRNIKADDQSSHIVGRLAVARA